MRYLHLNQGHCPGDAIVATRMIYDLSSKIVDGERVKDPDFDIVVTSPMMALFENHPFINKGLIFKPEQLKFYPNELIKNGYELGEVAYNHKKIFEDLIEGCKLNVKRSKNKKYWYYYLNGDKVFKSLNKAKSAPKREYVDLKYSDHEPSIHDSGWSGLHFSSAYYSEIKGKLGITIKQTSLFPILFLSDEEKSWTNQVEEETGYRGKFWLINSGSKNDFPLKQWGFDNWQKVVNILRDKIQFVQVGEKTDGHNHQPLDGVIDMVGKTDLRQLVRLSYHAQGGMSHVSMLHHLMAAWEKPHVTIAGGREGRRWESYPNIRYFDTNGLLNCCSYDGCWQSGKIETENDKVENKTCKNMVGNKTKCMQMIKPEYVAEGVLSYYYGGRLSF